MTADDFTLLGRWIAARVRFTLRSPRALGFTFAFPLVLVTLFGALNAGQEVAAPSGGDVPFAQYYTPAIGVFAVTLACYSSLIIGVATARETGLLKRVRGTPLPLRVYLGAWLTGAALVGIASVVLLFAVAVPALGVEVYARTLPQAALTLALGAACLGSLGLALGTVAKTSEQAQPLAQLTFLPISFISGVWFPHHRRAVVAHSRGELLPALTPRRRVLGLLRAGRQRARLRPRVAGAVGRRRDAGGGASPARVVSRLIPSFRSGGPKLLGRACPPWKSTCSGSPAALPASPRSCSPARPSASA